jgi:transposase
MVYIGVDLHRKVSQVAAVQANGEVLWNRRIRSRPEEFAEIVGDLPATPAGVAFEATYGWGWFADLLADLGLAAHMSHPKATKAISAARVKNDAVDAETLAQLLRTNLLPEAWIAPPVCREARRLVRTRAALVRLRSRFKCQLLALLAEHGVQRPEVADPFGKEGRRFIQSVALAEQSQVCLTANLRVIDLLTTARDAKGRDLELDGLTRHALFQAWFLVSVVGASGKRTTLRSEFQPSSHHDRPSPKRQDRGDYG